MQSTGFGCTVPLYAFVHMLATRTQPAPPLKLTSIPRIQALFPAVILGFLFPTIWMIVSKLQYSSEIHQYSVAAWQIFPVYVAIAQAFLANTLYRREVNPLTAKRQLKTLVAMLHGLLESYSALFQLGFIGYAALSWWNPRLPTFNAARFAKLQNPISPAPVASFADGVLSFLQYDYRVGMVAAIVWAWATAKQVTPKARGWTDVGLYGVWALVKGEIAGPGSVVAELSAERYEAEFTEAGI
jgi:hypothetical protein